jgi:hypothetical protein
MAGRRSCLQRASDPTFRRESVVASLRERHDIAELEGSPDSRFQPSVRGKPRGHGQPHEGSQAIRHPWGVAFPRTVPPYHRRRSRPESADRHRRQRTTCHDHDVWSRDKPSIGGHQPEPPGGGDRLLTAGIEDTFPRFVAFRRSQMRRSLTRWIASPAPSALRVSHPLSGLIPAHPRGCCFKPHPSVGFMGLQSLFRRGQP